MKTAAKFLQQPAHPPQKAFSLVELSIVLVILGLLVGGILAGQSLIRASELRSVGTQYLGFKTATAAFKDKYLSIPGDMANATAFWGAADGSTGTTGACKTIDSTGITATCNGNGAGTISTSLSYTLEGFRFWQHLTNAGLIEGTFSGIADGSTNNAASSKNSPSSKLRNGIWFVSTLAANGNSSVFDGNYGNSYELGGYYVDSDPRSSLLLPEDAWNLDTKLDDGKPAQGIIWARDTSGFSGANCTTATSSADSNADYYLPQTRPRCVLYFRNAF